MTEPLIEPLIEPYVFAIVALLPLAAGLLVTQVNPYHALVIRGILGAVAALVYALFGAADVALTEALVGTMLSITLYAVAVRSSLSMRIGIVAPPHGDESSAAGGSEAGSKDLPVEMPAETPAEPAFHSKIPPVSEPLRSWLQPPLRRHHMRVEFVSYDSPQALEEAIAAKEIHAVYRRSDALAPGKPLADAAATAGSPDHHLQIRVPRLYQILRAELPPAVALTPMGASSDETSSMTPPPAAATTPTAEKPE